MHKDSPNDKAKERISSLEVEIAELTELIENPPISEKAIKAGENILKRGNVLKFLVQQAQRNHIGDTDVIKHLIASTASTNSAKSQGIQPELNGPKGHGKTDAVRAVFFLVPGKWKLSASVTAKSLYYYPDMPDGTIIFSDDVEWSKELIATVKRSMGSFQERQAHVTLDAHREVQEMEMACRLAWWLSSVESVADDQVKDRQYSLDIDEGTDHTKEVSIYLRSSRARKKVRFSLDWRFEVARYIIGQIKEHELFRVVIPCADYADWMIVNDHRTQNKFWDLVEAFAIIRFRQRHIDEDGWLHATIEDFNEAKTIFMKRRTSHRTHLTNQQVRLIQTLIRIQGDKGASHALLSDEMGVTYQAVQKTLRAIESNTPYIIHELGEHGTKLYHTTAVGLEVAYANDNEIVTLPDNYVDPEQGTTLLQPCYNQPYNQYNQ